MLDNGLSTASNFAPLDLRAVLRRAGMESTNRVGGRSRIRENRQFGSCVEDFEELRTRRDPRIPNAERVRRASVIASPTELPFISHT